MDRSEQVAAAVALRAGGPRRRAEPRGVARRGGRGRRSRGEGARERRRDRRGRRTQGAHRRAAPAGDVGRSSPATTSRLRLRRDGKIARANRRAPWPRRTTRSARSSASASRRTRRSSCRSTSDIDLGNVGGPSAGLPFALAGLPGARQRRRPRLPGRGDRARSSSTAASARSGASSRRRTASDRPGADVFLVPAGENAATATALCRGLARHPCGEF